MAKRKGGGGLRRTFLENDNETRDEYPKNIQRGQEITGVTLPANGKIKGWEFGQGVRMACVNLDETYYALEGQCPRCGFDLWRGDVIVNDEAFDDLPRLACPTCSTTYSLRTGKHGPPLKRTGLQEFVGKLAKTATEKDSYKDAKAFQIIKEDGGRVYCREKENKTK